MRRRSPAVSPRTLGLPGAPRPGFRPEGVAPSPGHRLLLGAGSAHRPYFLPVSADPTEPRARGGVPSSSRPHARGRARASETACGGAKRPRTRRDAQGRRSGPDAHGGCVGEFPQKEAERGQPPGGAWLGCLPAEWLGSVTLRRPVDRRPRVPVLGPRPTPTGPPTCGVKRKLCSGQHSSNVSPQAPIPPPSFRVSAHQGAQASADSNP